MSIKEVYFSAAEEEMIESLQEIYGITYIEACEYVIIQKRELAFIHRQRGNYALERTILKELGEWTDELEEEYQSKGLDSSESSDDKKIILLS